MKKVMLFIAAEIIAFCIVPIATTQAMPQRIQQDDSFASNDVLCVLNQKDLRNMDMELNNPVLEDNILNRDIQYLRVTTIAQTGTSTTTTSTGKANPHVQRSGHGRSKMNKEVVVEEGNKDNEGGDEDLETEKFGDDSAVDYNKGLKNTSGYNEDL